MAARDGPVPAHRRRTVLAVILGAVLVAAGLTTYLATRSSPDRGATAAPARAAPATSVAARPTQSRSSSPSPSPSPSATVPRDPVRPAVPTAFTLTGARFTIKAH